MSSSIGLSPVEVSPVYPISPAESVEQLEPQPGPRRSSSIPIAKPTTSLESSTDNPLLPPSAASSSSISPARRRPKPPTKGILKPPPPPPKPTLGNRLRDLAANVVGGSPSSSRGLFESDDYSAGPSSQAVGGVASVSAAVGGTLNALGGRLGMGLSRFVTAATSPSTTPTASPMGGSKIGLPDVGGSGSPSNHTGQIGVAPISEKARQKQPLRRATFVLPSLSITYPISSQGEPWSAKVIEDRQRIESSHRIFLTSSTGAEYWTSARLVKLYETACKGRDEKPRVSIVRAFEVLPPHPRPRQIHLILQPPDPTSSQHHQSTLDTPLNRHHAESLADVLSSEWGLGDLKLEGGMIEDDLALKPILHALLVSGTLPSLSLAGNRKIREKGWRLLAIFLKKARSLRYVDLSDTTWDRRSIEYIVQALSAHTLHSPILPHDTDKLGLDTGEKGQDDGMEVERDCYGSFVPPAPLLRDDEELRTAGVQTLRMDGCGLRTNLLEPLASGVRSSDIKNLSLRRNRISPPGAVALALMIKDYPDTSSTTLSALSSDSPAGYSPYTPRQRRTYDHSSPSLRSNQPLPPVPLISSNSMPLEDEADCKPKVPLKSNGEMGLGIHNGGTSLSTAAAEGKLVGPDIGGASVALQRQVRSLDNVERIGRLLTLDLKGNEIRNGVTYIAQVLKRNRTLKVLNLSDNRIEPPGLAALGEALKYNSTLETLDLSSNPCCGPSLEGITSLRTAFTVNISLKRLFLSETNLSSEGAIALAEFLPESKSLLHLDLTNNPLDVAGILALSSGLKSNALIRCLDISIPPNNPDLADLSQSILQTCIRNTEIAADTTGKHGEAIWGPIKKSLLVRQAKEAESARLEQERVDIAKSPEGLAREYVYKLTPDRIISVAEITGRDLDRWLEAGKISRQPGFYAWEPGPLPREDWTSLVERAKAIRERLADEITRTEDDQALARMLELNDSLQAVLESAKGFVPPPRLLLPSQIITNPLISPNQNGHPGNGLGIGSAPIPSPSIARHRRHMRGTSLEISSPNFSIGDSDNDSDAEELDVGKLPSTPQPQPRSHGRRRNESYRPDLRLEVSDEAELALALREAAGADEDEGGSASSPVDRVGRAWIEEEGEVFRKGTKLGVLADDEEVEEHGDISGEILRQEILDTEVARSPTRRVITVDDEDGEGGGEAKVGEVGK